MAQLQSGDEEILAMCDPTPSVRSHTPHLRNDLHVDQSGTSRTHRAQRNEFQGFSQPRPVFDIKSLADLGLGQDMNAFNFNLGGGIMTLNNSELQIGTKIVTSPPNTGGVDTPFIKVTDQNSDRVDLSTTSERDHDKGAGGEEGGGQTLHIKITPNGPVHTHQEMQGNYGTVDHMLTHDSVPLSLCRASPRPSPRPLAKAVSIPTPLRPSAGTASTASSSPLPPDTVLSGGQPPTFVNSSIHKGTKIVIKYTNCSHEASKLVTAAPTTAVPIPPFSQRPLAPYLEEFREKLRHSYLQRSRASLLPWHLGRTVTPLDDYYLEPRIFAVDRRGRATTAPVTLHEALEQGHETRYLVEGEAGMGKTLLAARLARDWAEGRRLVRFGLVLLVTLSDFQGSLEAYIRNEFLPSYFGLDKFRKVWDYWKSHEEDIVFILDGYDELQKFDKFEVENLISSKDFPNSRVLVTSRPAVLQCQATKLVVKGFNEHQIWKFIEKYFDVVEDSKSGASLQKILERHGKYRKLAERPLFCVLLCMLYETDSSARKDLPDRMSDVLYKIMLCLIKWSMSKNNKGNSEEMDGIPPEYEEAFDQFGQVCVQAIKKDRYRFSEEDVKNIPHFEKIRQLGFLYNDDESALLRNYQFWKPIHQTFIEYLAAVHIANHIRKCRWGCRYCRKFASLLERKDSEILIYTAGVLGCHAYRLFSLTRYPKLRKLSETELLTLLREAGPSEQNKKVIAGLLDRESAVITTNEADIEGWTHLLPESFHKLHTLELVWRIKSPNPDQESSFMEASEEAVSAFFTALNKNTSVQTLKFRAKQDGASFTEEKLSLFFPDLYKTFLKKHLRTLEFRNMKMDLGAHLRMSFEKASQTITEACPTFGELRTVKLDTFLSSGDLDAVCAALRVAAPRLEALHLHGLELGQHGFSSLARLLRERSTLHTLHLSMNKAYLVNAFGSAEELDYPPDAMHSDLKAQRMKRIAAKKSYKEFTQHKYEETNSSSFSPDPQSTNVKLPFVFTSDGYSSEEGSPTPTSGAAVKSHPFKELPFLFDEDKHGAKKVPQARHYWYIKGSETKLPLPICVGNEHKSVFHYLFSALPESHLKHLMLDQPGFYLTIADLVCLGDAIRKAKYLTSLDLQGLDKVKCYVPILVALAQSPALESLNLSSDHVTVDDAAFQLACSALRHNTSLRALSLANWRFVLQDKLASERHLTSVLGSWRVRELNLKHCSVQLGKALLRTAGKEMRKSIETGLEHKDLDTKDIDKKGLDKSHDNNSPGNKGVDNELEQKIELEVSKAIRQQNKEAEMRKINIASQLVFSPPIMALQIPSQHCPWRSVTSLVLAEAEVQGEQTLRGPSILPAIKNFVSVTSLDLSVSLARPTVVNDCEAQRFFKLISELPLLRDLSLTHWQFALDETPSSCAKLSDLLKQCRNLRLMKLHSVNEQRPQRELANCETSLLHTLVSSLPGLRHLSVCWYTVNHQSLDPESATRLARCLHQHWIRNQVTLQVFSVSADVASALKVGLSQPPCYVRVQDSPPLILSLSVHRPVLPQCLCG